jgi:hypothetical protein
MIHLILLIAMIAGFACLCVANPRHRPHLLGARVHLRREKAVRGLGWSLVSGATIVSCFALGIGYGLVEAFGLASVAAAVQVAQLCRAMHLKRPAWRIPPKKSEGHVTLARAVSSSR